MKHGPDAATIGTVIQPPGARARTQHILGQPEQYTSIYGYAKLKIPVHEIELQTGKPGGCVGHIKQEPMVDEHGTLVGFAYYTKAAWRDKGQLRFYPTPEALLAAYDMPLYKGVMFDDETAMADEAETATAASASSDTGVSDTTV